MSTHNYLFFVAHSYAYNILRPLQVLIRQQGGHTAWFIESTSPDLLEDDELRLHNLAEVRRFNPRAVFAPGDWVYPFFPGIKVRVCHGYPIYKRGGSVETHFKIRGYFDIYCTSGPSSTPIFQRLQQQHQSFQVYETGWSKVDDIVTARQRRKASENTLGHRPPTIFVATTFSRHVTQLRNLLPVIDRLSKQEPWQWVITMHPKLEDPDLKAELTRLAEERSNLQFLPLTPPPSVMAQTDVMLCDSSSIILEYMMLDLPVVTLRNTTPGPHLINVQTPDKVEEAIRIALTRPPQLMEAIHRYLDFHESHRDGHNCQRILDAVDDFQCHHQGHLKARRPNLWRSIQMYWKFMKNACLG